jgi:hypothetical protein
VLRGFWLFCRVQSGKARILLEHHADPHRCDIHGHSPFTVAKQKGFKEILDIIEQHSSHEIP